MRIHALGNALSYHKFHYPIRVFEKELRELNLDITFFSNTTQLGISNCDVLIFYEDNYRNLLPIPQKDRRTALGFLQRFFERFPRVIWFDGNDGSRWLCTYVFSLIDVYAKSHLMTDRGYYQTIHPTGFPHRDYVKENFNIDDPRKNKGTITDSDQGKLRIAWNMAFRNWSWKNIPWYDIMMGILHRPGYGFKCTPPELVNRGFLIPYRVSYWENNPTVTWWRTRTREELEKEIQRNPPYYLNSSGRVKRTQFANELRNSKVAVSPFGIGEYDYRDFESFIHGSLLFKPDMSHQQTWPNFYIDGETYISHRWDFSDFGDKLSEILAYPQRFEEIAQEGQALFRKAVSDGEAFAQRFLELIN